jgi:hypothetical protein
MRAHAAAISGKWFNATDALPKMSEVGKAAPVQPRLSNFPQDRNVEHYPLYKLTKRPCRNDAHLASAGSARIGSVGSRGRPALPRGRRGCFQFVSVARRRVKWPRPGLGTNARAFLERHARTFCRPATRTSARSPRPFHAACRSIGELRARCRGVHVAFAGGR